ncbi:rhodanese-like domain-containing protein [Streptosporangium sp. NBC_01755]|uniref:rhodanese-like domain-containing protein n=1 Tax=Streptosporangium sp. NBC_01755 TaxID=2975949 RepID=UPI002DD947E0|nr:rhodanese-like domain-containing protein [Streptosporangium sp. NBC_01755]WSC99847.1 rhodanese-like domain-containing protein [Streptosporangium sp. NBC_01755]
MTIRSDTPATLDVAALRHLMDSGSAPRLIDVRTPGEFETAHVPGSVNVPLDLLREHRERLRAHLDGSEREQVVLVCRSGQRAAQAAAALAGAGPVGPRVLEGGILAWQGAGAPLRTGRARWELERQVRLVAGSLVLTSILAGTLFPPAKWLAAAIGGGLTFAALSNTCAMGMLLAKLPYNRGPRRPDLEAVLSRLAQRETTP